MHNISQEDVERGQVQYVMHGKEMEKNRYAEFMLGLCNAYLTFCVAHVQCHLFIVFDVHVGMCRIALSLVNLWARMGVFYRFHFWRVHESMPHVLLRMVRSGHFYPAGAWVVPTAGKGMVIGRAEACWKMLTVPQETNMMDVHLVFFEDSKFRYTHDPAPDITPTEEAEISASGAATSMVAKVMQLARQRAANQAAGVLEPDLPI